MLRKWQHKHCEIISTLVLISMMVSASAPETEWNKLLLNGLSIGKGDISHEDLYAVVKKRIERVLIRTVSIPLEFLASFG